MPGKQSEQVEVRKAVIRWIRATIDPSSLFAIVLDSRMSRNGQDFRRIT